MGHCTTCSENELLEFEEHSSEESPLHEAMQLVVKSLVVTGLLMASIGLAVDASRANATVPAPHAGQVIETAGEKPVTKPRQPRTMTEGERKAAKVYMSLLFTAMGDR